MAVITENRRRAALMALIAIGLATTQDAIVKSMSDTYPAHETVIIRCLSSLPLLFGWLLATGGLTSLRTPHLPLILLRAIILCSAYFAFILSISAMPLANAVSIYFTMPFFVAALAGPLLHERVPLYRLFAIIIGFCGVLIMERPGLTSFEPAALFALYSAAGYAVGQMLGRKLSGVVSPVVIANYQNATYLLVAVTMAVVFTSFNLHDETSKSLAFLTRPMVWPTLQDLAVLVIMGVFAALAMVCFITAYSLASSSFVAPFEYSSMIWAVFYGLVFFGDWPDGWHLLGLAVVVGAGYFMMNRDARAFHER